MRELAIITFVTMDGVMQGPSSPEEDPSGGFTGGGWAAPYWGEVMDQVRREAMSEPYDMLFGRRTYELFAGRWPKAGDESPDARMMNAATKYVATRSLTTSLWENSVLLDGDAVDEVARLKKEDGRLIQIHGSGDLITSLLAADLIDEFRLWTFPVVLGEGRRLFASGSSRREFRLKKSEPCSNGAVMTIYRRDA